MTETLYHGFRRIDFLFEDREAILVFPNEPRPDGKWLLKTEYFSAFQGFELEMVRRGFYLAFMKNITRWHDERDDDARARFCAFLAKEYGLAPHLYARRYELWWHACRLFCHQIPHLRRCALP